MSSCGCGSSCQCGSSCGGGCGMCPDVEKSTATAITIGGVAPPVKTYSEGSEKSTGTEAGHGCKCGSNCTCDPCNC